MRRQALLTENFIVVKYCGCQEVTKAASDCKYLEVNRFCGALSENEEGRAVREESCRNESKNLCCYLCEERDTCEVSCNYLGNVATSAITSSETIPTPTSSPGSSLVVFQKCHKCGAVNRRGSKFCKKCGAAMQILEKCPKCKSDLDMDSVFCPECGYKVKETETAQPSELTPKGLAAMSTPIDIQNYSSGWTAPLSLERLFADSLKSDPRLTKFKPQEIEPRKRSDTTLSNVAGALSTIIVGIGWKRERLPTSIVTLDSCPVHFSVFSRHDDFTRALFFFPIEPRIDSSKWGLTFIRRKGAGAFSSGNANELEIAPGSKSSPAIEELRADEAMVTRLLSLAAKGLNQKPWICTITYDRMGAISVGKIEFDIHHSKKKWQKALQELNFLAQDYVFDIVSSACSIAGHVGEYLEGNR